MKKLLLIPVLICGTVSSPLFANFIKGLKKVAGTGEAAYKAGRETHAELKAKKAEKEAASDEGTEKPKSSLAQKAKLAGLTGIGAARGGLTKYDEMKAKALKKKQERAGAAATTKEEEEEED